MTRNEAKAFIEAIITMRNNATDEQALKSIAVYPFWKPDVSYLIGDRVQHNKVLYKCAQVHTSQDNWVPDATPALWIAISLNDGTVEHPITAVRGMEYEVGKYYIDTEDGHTYRCTRSGVLQYLPHELVEHYFELTN